MNIRKVTANAVMVSIILLTSWWPLFGAIDSAFISFRATLRREYSAWLDALLMGRERRRMGGDGRRHEGRDVAPHAGDLAHQLRRDQIEEESRARCLARRRDPPGWPHRDRHGQRVRRCRVRLGRAAEARPRLGEARRLVPERATDEGMDKMVEFFNVFNGKK